MTISAFGVEHGDISKGLFGGAKKAAKAGKAAQAIPMKFNPITPKTPTGPGSLRAKMSQSAWETQTAAKKRKI